MLFELFELLFLKLHQFTDSSLKNPSEFNKTAPIYSTNWQPNAFLDVKQQFSIAIRFQNSDKWKLTRSSGNERDSVRALRNNGVFQIRSHCRGGILFSFNGYFIFILSRIYDYLFSFNFNFINERTCLTCVLRAQQEVQAKVICSFIKASFSITTGRNVNKLFGKRKQASMFFTFDIEA